MNATEAYEKDGKVQVKGTMSEKRLKDAALKLDLMATQQSAFMDQLQKEVMNKSEEKKMNNAAKRATKGVVLSQKTTQVL